MNIAEFDEAVQAAEKGDNIVYAKTGATPKSLMNHVLECSTAYGLGEEPMKGACLVELVQKRTGKDVFGPDLGTYDYIAQRTSVEY